MKNETLSSLPDLVVADEKGTLFEIPGFKMSGSSGAALLHPDPADLIPLPPGSDLFMLPGRIPVGWDTNTGKSAVLPAWQGKKIFAAAAFMAPGYMQTLLASYRSIKNAPRLPFYAYAALGWKNGKFYAAGVRTDRDPRQDPASLNLKRIEREAMKILKSPLKKNRLVRHLLENCVLRYGCPAARNYVLGRYEAPLPTSRACNARCLACISEQPCGTCVQAPQGRISFTPTPEEIAEMAVPHLEKAENPVVSFGQGCEGEPLLCADTLREAIRLIRNKTEQGVINLNTNASLPERLPALFEAGLDSIRISLNSARKQYYNAYFRPVNYSFDAVMESATLARRMKRWVSFNYFIFPGFTDSRSEFEALIKLIEEKKPNMIQTRNLNMDPEWYCESLKIPSHPGFGLRQWMSSLKGKFPSLAFGYFNPGREFMKKNRHAPL